ncbi:hypothetical protein [Bradyrhizobium sp.]|uniref:outer membrane protein n=1 Tax=Bradyrhizobium sp. TaxID=376 RepID=UPI0025BC7E83|nr:hypothetical protein [Bradyrhizobium sp.]
MLDWARVTATGHGRAAGELRTWIALCAFGLAGTTAAVAADLPLVTKAPPPVMASSWAGFYLGVHGGYAWGKNDFREHINGNADLVRDGLDSRGGVVGGHAGYNWQYGSALAGVELDFSAADVSGSAATTSVIAGNLFFSADRSDRLKYLGTARARVGWLASANVLLYGTGGLAWERVEETERHTTNSPGSPNFVVTRPFDRFGWVAGAGIEATPFGPNWVGRLEYLHYDFGAVQATNRQTSNFLPFNLTDQAGRQRFDVLRAGLSYKFGAPSGPMAAYASAPSAVAASWGGFYLGVHGGYGWGEDNFVSTPWPGTQVAGPNLRGGVYGGQAGYNWQFDRAVTGLELDFSSGNVGGSSNQVQYVIGPTTYTQSSTEKAEVLASLRGRLGWLPMDSVLLYGTAGIGWERLGTTEHFSSIAPGGSVNSSSYSAADRFGWVAGLGAEFMLPGGNWIGRLEYLHYGFGAINNSGVINNAAGTFAYESGSHDLDILRAGLSYKLGEPAAAAPTRYANATPLALASNWAGFYLGAHAGYGWYDDDFTTMIDPPTGTQAGGIRSSGWLGGGHAGYNWQYGRLVAGLEADFSFADVKGASTPATADWGGVLLTATLEDRIKYVGTARARLGWAPTDRVLLYATAGAAWERFERTRTETYTTGANYQSFIGTRPADRVGGVIGAGAEWMPFGPNWIGRLEYLHYDFGKVRDTTTVVSSLPAVFTFSERQGRQTMETVRLGLSYKFGSAAPN